MICQVKNLPYQICASRLHIPPQPTNGNDQVARPHPFVSSTYGDELSPSSSLHPRQLLIFTIFYFLAQTSSSSNAQKMASWAASKASASIGVKEMLGNPLNVSSTTVVRSSAPPSSIPSTFKPVALFFKKKAAPPPPPPKPVPVSSSSISDELAKWYGELHHYI